MPTRAVLFDMGNTLFFQARRPDWEELYPQMAEQVRPLLRAWGVEERLHAVALLRDLYGAVMSAEGEPDAHGYEVDAPFIARGALAAYGVEVSAEQARSFWRATALNPVAWGWQLYSDTLDTLRRLRSLYVPTALVSNGWYTSDMMQPIMACLGITEELFDTFVCSADLMRRKPHPAPFRRALEALDVAATQAVFVGDDFEADIRGAKALGMTTVWKLNGRQNAPPAPEADFIIHDLCEIFSLGLLPEAGSAMGAKGA